MCAREIGSTDNFTSAPEGVLPLSQADYDLEYKFVGENPLVIMELFAWETIRPNNADEFLSLSFSARSSSWSEEGQAVMMELQGTGAKYNCVQISHTEFKQLFAPNGSTLYLSSEINRTQQKVDGIIH